MDALRWLSSSMAHASLGRRAILDVVIAGRDTSAMGHSQNTDDRRTL
jgi:hypothetical protein